MNIEFHFNNIEEDLMASFFCKNFPDNINFNIGETIDIEGFLPMFTKGELYFPESDVFYMEIDEVYTHGCDGKITNIKHAFVKEVGYLMMVHIDLD